MNTLAQGAPGDAGLLETSMRLILACVLLSPLCVAGCSKSPYTLAAVRGRVTIDGRPVTNGKVMFAPAVSPQGQGINAGKPALGELGEDGSFVLGTYADADGAVVGPHTVTIIAYSDPPATPPPANAIIPKFRRLAVPRRYTVEAGKENQLSIELTQQDVAKYGQR